MATKKTTFAIGDLVSRKALTPRYNGDGTAGNPYHIVSTIIAARERQGQPIFGMDVTGFGMIWDSAEALEHYEHEPTE